MARQSKGSAFERDICKQLSLWWTGGDRDDVFWRASNSGGRAKFRGRQGKDTYGQHGDVAAVDPIGNPLIDAFTIEIKRGYAKATPFDLMDKSPSMSQQEWEKWHQQVYESWQQAGSYSYALITKRDQRQPMIFFPMWSFSLWHHKKSAFFIPENSLLVGNRHLIFATKIVHKQDKIVQEVGESMVGLLLDGFLRACSPQSIKEAMQYV